MKNINETTIIPINILKENSIFFCGVENFCENMCCVCLSVYVCLCVCLCSMVVADNKNIIRWCHISGILVLSRLSCQLSTVSCCLCFYCLVNSSICFYYCLLSIIYYYYYHYVIHISCFIFFFIKVFFNTWYMARHLFYWFS